MGMMMVKNICVFMVFLMLHTYNKKPYEFYIAK